MANKKYKLSDSDYWEASGVYDITEGKTQRAINAEVKGSLNVLNTFSNPVMYNWREYATLKSAITALADTIFSAVHSYTFSCVTSGGYRYYCILGRDSTTKIGVYAIEFNGAPFSFTSNDNGQTWIDQANPTSNKALIDLLTANGTITNITTENTNFTIINTAQQPSQYVARGNTIEAHCVITCNNSVSGWQAIATLPTPYNFNTLYLPPWVSYADGSQPTFADTLFQSGILYIRNAIAGKTYNTSFMYLV